MRYFWMAGGVVLSGVAGFWLSWVVHSPVEYSRPVMETFHSPATFVRQLEGDPDAGRKIFREFCSVCHDKTPQIDVNAPRIGDVSVWAAYSQRGLPWMLEGTLRGKGAMPARGGCFECSDNQIRQAIEYILKGHDKNDYDS